ncbi:Cell division protein FtsN [Halioglobus japonicus]|nr:Cell division protein FtsN [Halioglobus japonicus]
MPQDYAKRRQNTSKKKPAARKAQAHRQTGEPEPRGKGFRLYMTGVITGIFLSFLVYLGTLPEPVEPGQEVAATAQPEVEEVPKPRFDFYTLLPEQTIEIEEEVETVEPAADVRKPPSPTVAPQPYYLQAGSFRQREDAERRRAELLLLGLEPRITESTVDSGRWFRVSLGPFGSHDEVSRVRGLLANQNIDSVLLKRSAG